MHTSSYAILSDIHCNITIGIFMAYQEEELLFCITSVSHANKHDDIKWRNLTSQVNKKKATFKNICTICKQRFPNEP